MQAATAWLIDKVDVHGRATEGRRFMPDIKIVVAKCAAEGQIHVGMYVNAAGHDVLALAVDNLVTLCGQVLTDQYDFFAFDQYIGSYHITGSDDSTVFKQCSHELLLLSLFVISFWLLA